MKDQGINEYLRKTATSAVHLQPKEDPETFAIIGAAMEVHGTLGHGFLEAVYQDALEQELIRRGIPFHREHPIAVLYKGEKLATPYRADFVCYQNIIVELKAIKQLTVVDDAQVLHYLKSSGFDSALLFNFATPRLEYKRFVNNYLRKSAESAVQNGEFA